MGIEIERKFIVPTEHHQLFLGGTSYPQKGMIQAYLSKQPVVRLRLEDDRGVLTIKGASPDGGLSRPEWEIALAPGQTEEIIAKLNLTAMHKTRHIVQHLQDFWEVDVLRVNSVAGRAPIIWKYLVFAEFEHQDPEKVKSVTLPPWVGQEVTGDPQFAMSNLTEEHQRVLAWQAAYNYRGMKS